MIFVWPYMVTAVCIVPEFFFKKNKMLNPLISAVKVWNDVDQKFDLCAKRNELFSNLPPNLPLQVNCIRLIRPIRPPDRPFFERSWQVKQLPTRRNQKLLRNKILFLKLLLFFSVSNYKAGNSGLSLHFNRNIFR